MKTDWLEVAFALSNAAAGLSQIHEAGGFHRDIKPDNLLIAQSDDGTKIIKVGDFGLARVPKTAGHPMTRSVWGTDGYMAPELFTGNEFTRACDVYSLGVTGLELLTGSRQPAKLQGRPDIPQAFRELLLRMLRPLAAQRPTINVCQQILARLGQDEQAKREQALAQAELENRARENQVRAAQQVKERQTQEAKARQAREAEAQQARSRQAAAAAAAAGTIGLGSIFLLAGGIALATMNARDQNGRFRGNDGRYRSGRWG
jgi:hypothetical protein